MCLPAAARPQRAQRPGAAKCQLHGDRDLSAAAAESAAVTLAVSSRPPWPSACRCRQEGARGRPVGGGSGGGARAGLEGIAARSTLSASETPHLELCCTLPTGGSGPLGLGASQREDGRRTRGLQSEEYSNCTANLMLLTGWSRGRRPCTSPAGGAPNPVPWRRLNLRRHCDHISVPFEQACKA